MVGLAELFDVSSVKNVLIYIADSLRMDHLPEQVADRGVTIPTIAASTYTASSIPSMMTGNYPATHRIWGFNDVLSRSPRLLTGKNAGMDLRNVWTDIDDPAQKPPNRVLGLETEHRLEDADPGFTIVIHEKGAHAPYDFFNVEYETSPPYFRDYAGRDEQLRELYKKGANATGSRFLEKVSALEASGELSETLVIFTSDHGELLGETGRGGVYAHGSPVCPELVKVPTVFVGGGLPAGEQLDWTISGTDLAPTALGAQNRFEGMDVDGVNLWTTTPGDHRVVRSDFWARGGRIEYAASSAWDGGGGVVKHFGSTTERLVFGIHRKFIKGLQAPANRSGLLKSLVPFLRTFGKSVVTYDSPYAASCDDAVSGFETRETTTNAPEVTEEQLRALGYVE
jgi:hypothetical protein